jgi:hypothetical protein
MNKIYCSPEEWEGIEKIALVEWGIPEWGFPLG